MEVVDDEGRFFGLINIIDGLVVLLAISLLIAGASLLLGTDDPDTEQPTRYATISYSTPIESQAALLESGDNLTATNGSTTTTYEVVDVYRSFQPDGDAYVVGRIEYRGTFDTRGEEVLGGDVVSLAVNSYRVTGQVEAVNQSSQTIPTRQESIVLAMNGSESVVRTLESGQRATIGNETVAIVESVDRNDDSNRTLIGLELQVWERSVGPAFDGSLVRIGNSLTVVTDRAVVRGTIHRVGTTESRDA